MKNDAVKENQIKKDLREKGYSDPVIDHWLNPRNLGQMKYYDGFSDKITSTCGDSIWIWIKVRDNVITNISFISDICIGSVSAGSILTEKAEEKSIEEALQISAEEILDALGGLPKKYVHCTKLAEKALKFAIANYQKYEAAPWKKFYE